jgi:hypothetical protein
MREAQLRQIAEGFAGLFNLENNDIRISTEALFLGYGVDMQRALICLLIGAGDCKLTPNARKAFIRWLVEILTL